MVVPHKPNRMRRFKKVLTPEEMIEGLKDALAMRIQTMVCPICGAWLEGGGMHHKRCKLNTVEIGLDIRNVLDIGGLSYKEMKGNKKEEVNA